MNYILNSYWNSGIALAELVSSGLLMFFISTFMSIFKNNKNNSKLTLNVISSFVFSIAGTIAMIVGVGIGNLISGIGRVSGNKGIALMTPIFAIMQSIHWNAFNALPMILGFQLIGTIIGAFFYIYFIKIYNLINKDSKINKHYGLILINSSYYANCFKEVLAQILFLTIGFSIFTLDPLVVKDAELMLKGLYLTLSLFVLFMLFSNQEFFLLSWNISLVSLLISYYYKKTKTKHLINFLISIFVQLSIMSIISGIDFYKNKQNYA